jgi:hypothetical protein
MRFGLIGELGNVGIEAVDEETGPSANISVIKIGGLVPTSSKVKSMHVYNMHVQYAPFCFTPSETRFA